MRMVKSELPFVAGTYEMRFPGIYNICEIWDISGYKPIWVASLTGPNNQPAPMEAIEKWNSVDQICQLISESLPPVPFTNYPDTEEGRQSKHENRLYESALQ